MPHDDARTYVSKQTDSATNEDLATNEDSAAQMSREAVKEPVEDEEVEGFIEEEEDPVGMNEASAAAQMSSSESTRQTPEEDEEQVEVVEHPPGTSQMNSSESTKLPTEEEEVEVVERPPDFKGEDEDPVERRRRRRRRLQKIIQKAQGYPSFVALLGANLDVSDDEEDNDDDEEEDRPHEFKRIRIDLDVALGLKEAPRIIKTEEEPDSRQYCEATPADEGWYEGVVPLALPEDAHYLSQQHVWLRRNLELFSATQRDVAAAAAAAGRRTRTVRGRVGVRCIHCAKAVATVASSEQKSHPDEAVSSYQQSQLGAVSYPLSISGIHSACSQKTYQHFDQCPNLPAEEKQRLTQLTQEASVAPTKSRPRKSEGGLPAALYSIISAKRIGLVDVPDGIRFSRDLTLPPFPFETMRIQVQNELQQAAYEEDGDASLKPAPCVTADEESEAVLAEAVTEKDDPEKMLSRSDDKMLVTDYVFLLVRQMAICHAVPSDFASRGKKTKLMRVGLAGFCCRWCQQGGGAADYSCRSFSSAPDNLSSAISNSFAAHLVKCPNLPVRAKKALFAYKRLHPKQMTQLPYGSQRKLFHELWDRLRAADKTEEEMNEIMPKMPETVASFLPTKDEEEKQRSRAVKRRSGAGVEKQNDSLSGALRAVAYDLQTNEDAFQRPPGYPISDDPETQAIIQKAEADWNPEADESLILPSDRHLVSDYVFLTMRQLKKVLPNEQDVLRIKRMSTAPAGLRGVSCIHCDGQESNRVMPSGRSFPSAPDNFASALNTSLYNHMQVCYYVPADLKRALANTRKLHSAQCSSIRFGSQRRFFNRLYERLKPEETEVDSLQNQEVMAAEEGATQPQIPLHPKKDILAEYGFMEIPGVPALCKHCRMVPVHLRAPNSMFLGKRPPVDKLQEHTHRCTKQLFHLDLIADVLGEAVKRYFGDDLTVFERVSFKALIREAVGSHEELTAVFTDSVKQVLLQRRGSSEAVSQTKALWNCFPDSVNFASVENAFSTFAQEFPNAPNRLQDCPCLVRYLLLISPALVISEDETP